MDISNSFTPKFLFLLKTAGEKISIKTYLGSDHNEAENETHF